MKPRTTHCAISADTLELETGAVVVDRLELETVLALGVAVIDARPGMTRHVPQIDHEAECSHAENDVATQNPSVSPYPRSHSAVGTENSGGIQCSTF